MRFGALRTDAVLGEAAGQARTARLSGIRARRRSSVYRRWRARDPLRLLRALYARGGPHSAVSLAALFVRGKLLAGGIERISQPRKRHGFIEAQSADCCMDADQSHFVDRIDPEMTGRFVPRPDPDIDSDRAHHILAMAGIDVQSTRLCPGKQDPIDVAVTRHGLGAKPSALRN